MLVMDIVELVTGYSLYSGMQKLYLATYKISFGLV